MITKTIRIKALILMCCIEEGVDGGVSLKFVGASMRALRCWWWLGLSVARFVSVVWTVVEAGGGHALSCCVWLSPRSYTSTRPPLVSLVLCHIRGFTRSSPSPLLSACFVCVGVMVVTDVWIL